MKKIFLLFLATIMLVSCGDNKDENTLYVYSWADYIPQFVYEDFENETGIKVIEDIYSSNEEMYTKIKAGGEGYDIVMPSSDYYEIMMKEGMLAKLDKYFHSIPSGCTDQGQVIFFCKINCFRSRRSLAGENWNPCMDDL